VIDVQFAAIPGVLEELLRNFRTAGTIQGEDIDPLEIAPHITYIQDASLLICKIRATLENDCSRRVVVGFRAAPNRA